MSHRKYPVVIVGAGISGLAVAHYVSLAGGEVVVLEAGPRPGGVIATRRCDGRVLELGPQRTRLTAPFRALVDALGLSDQLLKAPELPLYIFATGKLRKVPLDVQSMLTSDLLSWSNRMRALAEPWTRGITGDESTADFFSRKFGRAAYERLFGPLFGDLYGSDPAEMPARHALALFLRTLRVEGSLLKAIMRGLRQRGAAPSCSFRDGMQTLTDALARQLGDRVRTAAPVHAIHRNGAGLRVLTEEEEIRAAHVVLTCPAPEASRMLAPLDVEAARALTGLRYNTLAVVHLHCERRMEGSGYQVTFDAGYATRGVTCNEALFGRPGIYTAFLGGAGRPEVSGLPDAELGALAAREFGAVTGAAAAPLAVHRTKMPAWDVSWNAMDGLRLPGEISICANWRGRAGITGRLGEAAELARHLTA